MLDIWLCFVIMNMLIFMMIQSKVFQALYKRNRKWTSFRMLMVCFVLSAFGPITFVIAIITIIRGGK